MNGAHEITVRGLGMEDIPLIVDYWHNADEAFLRGMGADIHKLPGRNEFAQMLENQLSLPDSKKSSLAMIMEVDGNPEGHCNVNKICFGKEAFMHLHIWKPGKRMKGMGRFMVKASIPHFFERLQLETLWCEPMAGNPAPNKTLKKLGFEFIKRYKTIPGAINFEQEVNQYRLDRNGLKEMMA